MRLEVHKVTIKVSQKYFYIYSHVSPTPTSLPIQMVYAVQNSGGVTLKALKRFVFRWNKMKNRNVLINLGNGMLPSINMQHELIFKYGWVRNIKPSLESNFNRFCANQTIKVCAIKWVNDKMAKITKNIPFQHRKSRCMEREGESENEIRFITKDNRLYWTSSTCFGGSITT